MTRQIRFGDWGFQPDTHTLTIGQAQKPLEPKIARLLEYFLAHPDEVLSHDQLVNAVWDGRVISDEAVRRGISTLRQALAADGSNGYIKTIHKKGYLADFPPPTEQTPEPGILPQSSSPAGATDVPSILPAGASVPPAARRLFHPGSGLLALVVVLLIGAYLLHLALLDPAPDASPSVAVSAPVTIAVLPFVNLGEEPATDYFSSGLAEELLGLLGQVDAFQVTARSSSFQFKANGEDVREVGRRLGVRYVLEGSVRKAADKIRIGVQLSDTRSGFNLWSETWERNVGDTFAVQQDIARNVVKQLQVAIVSTRNPVFKESSTASIEAHDEYLQARRLLATWVVSDADAAAEHLQRAIALDPDYAAAYALLADAIIVRAASTQSVAKVREVVAPLVQKALELEPELGEAYVTRSWLSDDPLQRERDLRRGLELNPSSARGHEMLADLLAAFPERRDEAYRLIDRARALDPLMPNNDHIKAKMLIQQGRWAEAEELEQHAIELDPRFRAALVRLGNLSALKGDFASAVVYGERAVAIDPRAEWVRDELVWFYLDLDDLQGATHANQPATPLGRMEILLAKGDWKAAGEILYALDDSERDRIEDAWVSKIALLHAHVTGQYARALALLARRLGFDGTVPVLDMPWELIQYAELAHVLRGSGNESGSLALARRLLTQLPELERRTPGLSRFTEIARAILLAQGADMPGALAALERASQVSPMPVWWIYLKDYPDFAPLRAEPRFQALLAHAREHAARQRELLARMRGGDGIAGNVQPTPVGNGNVEQSASY